MTDNQIKVPEVSYKELVPVGQCSRSELINKYSRKEIELRDLIKGITGVDINEIQLCPWGSCKFTPSYYMFKTMELIKEQKEDPIKLFNLENVKPKKSKTIKKKIVSKFCVDAIKYECTEFIANYEDDDDDYVDLKYILEKFPKLSKIFKEKNNYLDSILNYCIEYADILFFLKKVFPVVFEYDENFFRNKICTIGIKCFLLYHYGYIKDKNCFAGSST